MDKGIVVPLALFFSVAYTIKLLIDARMRYLFFKGGAPESVQLLLDGEAKLRRGNSLRSGVLMLALAAGIGLCVALAWPVFSVQGIAAVLAAGGIGNLLAFWLAKE